MPIKTLPHGRQEREGADEEIPHSFCHDGARLRQGLVSAVIMLVLKRQICSNTIDIRIRGKVAKT